MIIWIDGVLGIGKTTIALEVKERDRNNEIEYMDSDVYFAEMLNAIAEHAEKNHCFPAFRGFSPQTNQDFFVYFRKAIEEQSEKTKYLMISMSLIGKQCKEGILDYLYSKNKDILHVILTANKETIKSRINNDDKKRDKKTSLEILEDSILFLDNNFKDTLRIDTENKSVSDIADEIIEIIKNGK